APRLGLASAILPPGPVRHRSSSEEARSNSLPRSLPAHCRRGWETASLHCSSPPDPAFFGRRSTGVESLRGGATLTLPASHRHPVPRAAAGSAADHRLGRPLHLARLAQTTLRLNVPPSPPFSSVARQFNAARQHRRLISFRSSLEPRATQLPSSL